MKWSERLMEQVRNRPPPDAGPTLRSDADLHRFRFEMRLLLPVLPCLLGLWFAWDGRWATLPLFLMPLAALVLLHRFSLWWYRRKDRRDAGFPDWP
jgi:hypothetical protein